MTLTRALAGLALAGALTAPAAAQAATKDVYAGPPATKPPKNLPRDGHIARFFPSKVTVRAGDAVRFHRTACPQVSVTAASAAAPGFVIPSAQHPVKGAKDGAGATAWFEGLPNFVANPAVFAPTRSGAAFRGGKAISSGMPEGRGAPKPWTVRFTRQGTYRAWCPIFAPMSLTIEVVGKGERVLSAKAVRSRAKAQFRLAVGRLRALERVEAPANTIVAGPANATGELLFRFTPAKLTVKAGQPVSLQMSPGTHEMHTFTFFKDMKAGVKRSEAFFGPLPNYGKKAPIGLDPELAYRSAPAGEALAHGGGRNGGFTNTGLLDGGDVSPVPSEDSVTFSAPGTYGYLCAIHPDMQGEVTVTS